MHLLPSSDAPAPIPANCGALQTLLGFREGTVRPLALSRCLFPPGLSVRVRLSPAPVPLSGPSEGHEPSRPCPLSPPPPKAAFAKNPAQLSPGPHETAAPCNAGRWEPNQCTYRAYSYLHDMRRRRRRRQRHDDGGDSASLHWTGLRPRRRLVMTDPRAHLLVHDGLRAAPHASQHRQSLPTWPPPPPPSQMQRKRMVRTTEIKICTKTNCP
ncbi:hypothetical protein EDB81DRAFT_171986 [Dactylonectria macrodidyma]|uniref:Uncharacterized protein n=1 Tax=Dactylonectria macrodidyma TaxID=307937 RepID=A0A9P9JL82_9HYPO|nr:hypothetical protein EDB81DRAFT_171986 [Dactylonectria macrodidyma]